MNISLLKKPSAFLPPAMSLAALAIVLGHVAMYGIIHKADEGSAAHLFQILMAGQLPIVVYFAVKWLPRSPRQAWLVLAVQAVAVLPALAAVYWLT